MEDEEGADVAKGEEKPAVTSGSAIAAALSGTVEASKDVDRKQQGMKGKRMVCVTTVFLDELAMRFYQRNGMHTELPPYAAKRRGGILRVPRIWDNDSKRLYMYWTDEADGPEDQTALAKFQKAVGVLCGAFRTDEAT